MHCQCRAVYAGTHGCARMIARLRTQERTAAYAPTQACASSNLLHIKCSTIHELVEGEGGAKGKREEEEERERGRGERVRGKERRILKQVNYFIIFSRLSILCSFAFFSGVVDDDSGGSGGFCESCRFGGLDELSGFCGSLGFSPCTLIS